MFFLKLNNPVLFPVFSDLKTLTFAFQSTSTVAEKLLRRRPPF